jgi:hypothetical protein
MRTLFKLLPAWVVYPFNSSVEVIDLLTVVVREFGFDEPISVAFNATGTVVYVAEEVWTSSMEPLMRSQPRSRPDLYLAICWLLPMALMWAPIPKV